MKLASPQSVTHECKTEEEISTLFYKLAIAVLAVSYGAILAELPVDVFMDRQNYVNYVENSGIILADRMSSGMLPLLANEPLWLLMNAVLDRFLEPEQAIRFVIFLSASVFAFLVLAKSPSNFWWLLAFLFLPQIIKNYIVHLRQGVAISIFFLGWSLTGGKIRWAVMLLAPLIHASFFFVIGMMLMVNVLAHLNISPGFRGVVYVTAGAAAAMLTSFFAGLLGARQALEYSFSAVDISGAGFAFWLSMLLVFLLQGKEFLRTFSFPFSIILFYLGTYFFIEFSGRIFESVLVIVLLAGIQMRGWGRIVFSISILCYGGLAYLFSWGQPWLGFGHGMF